MKNKITYIFIVVAMCCMTSCHRTTYAVSFAIDYGNHVDTIHGTVKTDERFTFVGEDTHFSINVHPNRFCKSTYEYAAVCAGITLYRGPYPVSFVSMEFIK